MRCLSLPDCPEHLQSMVNGQSDCIISSVHGSKGGNPSTDGHRGVYRELSEGQSANPIRFPLRAQCTQNLLQRTMDAFCLPIGLGVMRCTVQASRPQALHQAAPKLTSKPRVTVVQHIIRHTILPHNLIEKKLCSFAGAQRSLPHCARAYTNYFGQSVHARKNRVKTSNRRQRRDKVHAP